jgi:hypothetical protein
MLLMVELELAEIVLVFEDGNQVGEQGGGGSDSAPVPGRGGL